MRLHFPMRYADKIGRMRKKPGQCPAIAEAANGLWKNTIRFDTASLLRNSKPTARIQNPRLYALLLPN